MDDIAYRGCRIEARAWALPGGGFGAKVVVQPGGSARAHLVVLRDTSRTKEEAQHLAAEVGRRFVDAGLA